jgi:addiction module HigA family antidote
MAEPNASVFRPMHDPSHPGRQLLLDCLEPARLTVSEGAKALGVSRQALSKLVNGSAGISPEMALRLAKAFGSTPDMWLRLQMAYDLARARKREGEITRNVRSVGVAG